MDLVLIRHGESVWNRDQRFTGWADVELTGAGTEQMRLAGQILHCEGFRFDLAFTSSLTRRVTPVHTLLAAMGDARIPVVADCRLSERDYGALTGMSKSAAETEFGVQAVQEWRRSYSARPPPWDGQHFTAPIRLATDTEPVIQSAPDGESLSDVVARILPFWEQSIKSALRDGKRVLITGHGNSLRALVKIIEEIPDDQVVSLEIPNAAPFMYQFESDFRMMKNAVLAPSTSTPSEIL